VLEVSPLPQLPVLALGAVQTGETGEERFNLKLDNQSNEELAINGGIPWLSFRSDRWRSPFVLLIDDVLNPGNLGAIIRSAYFLGVDAIAISTRTCAPLNSEAVKASAGAIEAIPIFAIHNVASFLENSIANGYWRIYCATTPDPKCPAFSSEKGSLVFTTKTDWRETTQSQNNKRFGPTFSSPLGVGHPVMLAIGGEQKGLDWKITRKAFAFVQIVPGISQLDVGVDSLNVSAASAILCAEFMRSKPGGLGISTRGRQTLEADRLGGPGPVYGRER
jgi:21S rRNA (GM2251-2'-O)-methyltransferase